MKAISLDSCVVIPIHSVRFMNGKICPCYLDCRQLCEEHEPLRRQAWEVTNVQDWGHWVDNTDDDVTDLTRQWLKHQRWKSGGGSKERVFYIRCSDWKFYLVWIRPQKITEESLVWHVGGSHDSADLFHALQISIMCLFKKSSLNSCTWHFDSSKPICLQTVINKTLILDGFREVLNNHPSNLQFVRWDICCQMSNIC